MTHETLRLIGQIIGYVAVAEGFLIFLSSRRERILIFKFIGDALWVASFLLQANYTGAILNAVAMGRETVFFNRDKHKWASSPIWLGVFMIVTAASPMFSLISGKEGWYAILPAMGSIAAVIGFYSRVPVITRYVSFVANGLWLFYDILGNNIPASISCVIQLISALIGLILTLVHKRQIKKNCVTPKISVDEQERQEESNAL